ncbi:MAG: type II toxin-antitoxin system VapC family toxin [Thermoflexales bacterium]|nr:type II toxin-antitoxin system VapC family toxin [Thermoflexales bacterium]
MSVSFVLDASVALAWCFEDEESAEAVEVLERLKRERAIVPALWFLEVGNALLSAERHGHLTPTESAYFLELLRRLPLQAEEIPPARILGEILSLARVHRLSTYDACYLDLAMRLGLPIATLDEGLRRAAEECGVEVIGNARR